MDSPLLTWADDAVLPVVLDAASPWLNNAMATALAAYPMESVGFLVYAGTCNTQDTGELEWIPCPNVFPRPDLAFRVRASDFARAARCGDIVALIHSHVGHDAAAGMAFTRPDREAMLASNIDWLLLDILEGCPCQ